MNQPRGGLIATIAGQQAPLDALRVPLTGVKIGVTARGTASAVTVSQRYVNREAVPVEAVYSFPLEEQSAVCGFEAVIDGRRVVGRVLEKDAAFDEYDEAMAAGHGAFLLDQDRPNLFTASVGNLLPGQDVVVSVRYVAPLERLGDQIRLKIPSTVSPRYVPAEQLRKMDPSEFDHLNPPLVPGGVPYGLELAVDFLAASEVTAVECPSHPARVSMRGTSARVELSGPDVQLDQDVVITFTMKDAGETALYSVRDEQGDYVLQLDVQPAADEAREAVEAVFLIDRSGSMQGSSFTQARNALLLALSSLREGDRFNVVGFGSRFEKVFDGPVAYVDASLNTARAAVKGWGADLGGTELLAPLTAILEAPAGELPRRLLVLTDGEVSNEASCHALVAQHAAATSVFAIGVGYGASDHLVRGLARAGRGEAEFVHPEERIEAAVLRQVARLTASGLRDVRVDWGGLPVDLVAPAQLPPLFPGTPLTVWARVPADGVTADGPVEIALVATSADSEVRLSQALRLSEAQEDAAVPRLLAREAIRDLEEGQYAAAGRGSQQRGRREARVKNAIVALATRYTLMSSETSFVAVEEREGEAAAEMPAAELRRIPVALLKDWHGGGRIMGMSAFAMSRDAGPVEPAYMRDADPSAPRFTTHETLHGMSAMPLPSHPAPAFGEGTPDLLVELVALQRADGSWPLGEELLGPLQIPRVRFDEIFAELRIAEAVRADAAATLLALHVLRTAFADYEDEWRLVAAKAETWLRTRLRTPPPAGFDSFEAWASDRFAWWAPPPELI